MKKLKRETKARKFNLSKIILIVSFVYFVAVLSFSLGYRKVGNYDIETDFFWDYAIEAKNILKGIINIGEFRGPGYPAVVAILSLLTSDLFKAGLIISALSSALVILMSFKILEKVFDEKSLFFLP